MSEYKMKDLGYERTPTNARYVVEMPDISFWSIPLQIIADSRDENYAEDQEDTIGHIRDETLNEYEIQDWAANNMNWDEVEKYASKVAHPKAKPVDYQEGWCNGEKTISGKI